MTSRRSWMRTPVAVLGVTGLLLGLAACGGSGQASSGSGAKDGGSSAAAAKALAPFVGQPSPFPVTDKLKKVPKGATIAFMDCGTPVCGQFWALLGPAAHTMGVKLERIKAGFAASAVSAAFDSVVASRPDAVIISPIEPDLYKTQLQELQRANIPVVTTGVTNAAAFGIKSPQYAIPQTVQVGKLLADYVAAKVGSKAHVAFYYEPELDFSKVMQKAVEDELKAVCPGCSIRSTPIAAATVGNTAPNTIVSDLQDHPDTSVAVFAGDEMEIGLPAAMKQAGINVKTVGATPTPTNLQYLKDGQETASLGLDLPVLTWTLLDQSAREIVGQKLTGPEAKGLTVIQFLTKDDITFDPSKGWTGYPDYAKRFARLWGVNG